jgi:polar amino acid transport system substrate-binding protein
MASEAKEGATEDTNEVKICYHDGEWPPYIYYKRDKGKINDAEIEGATVELFNKIFKRIGLKHSTTMMAWKRCLYEVTHFNTKNTYEMFTNGSYNEDRASKYYITAPLYKTNQALFYSNKKIQNTSQD